MQCLHKYKQFDTCIYGMFMEDFIVKAITIYTHKATK